MRTLFLSCLLCFSILRLDSQGPAHPGIWLDLPEVNLQVDENGALSLPKSPISHFLIHLNRQQQQINYGSVTAKINTMSAGPVMNTVSRPEGIVCEFDLKRYANFLLRPGRNSVEISYSDPYNRVHYASFLLDVGGLGETVAGRGIATAKALQPDRRPGAKFAVVVGISRYKNSGSGIPNLRYATADASAFRDFLLSPQGGSFPRDNIKVLLDEDATVQNVRSALFTFLTTPGPQDIVVLYWAGHGAADPNDQRNLYLLTYDTRIDDMGGTALRMEEFQDVYRSMKAKRVVTFTDSCHSYGISGLKKGASEKENNLINQYLAAYAGLEDRAVITASDISQLSFEGEKWGGGHGVFTYYLLRGLSGEADKNKDGTVTAGELFQYVHDQVSLETHAKQTPVALPGLAQSVPLSGTGMRAAGPN
jgi:hypothetical protein